MKVLHIDYDEERASTGLAELADSMKLLIHEHDSSMFDFIDFDNDTIYLEPSLFYYFKMTEQKLKTRYSLDQILFGYATDRSRFLKFEASSDASGVLYLPNIGTLQLEKAVSHSKAEYDIARDILRLNGKEYPVQSLRPFPRVKNDFNIRTNIPEILFTFYYSKFSETLASTAQKNEHLLNNTLDIIQNLDPNFYQQLTRTTREFTLFNSENTFSFAALTHFGTSFLNLFHQANPNEIFFLEDIAHQCGHVMFYPQILDGKEFLRVHKKTPLKEFTKIKEDDRNVYGALHGLFTYSCILHIFHLALEKKAIASEVHRHELMARMGFYARKFFMDLSMMDNNAILTRQGREFFDQCFESFLFIRKNYEADYRYFMYNDQPYIFDREKFILENTTENVPV